VVNHELETPESVIFNICEEGISICFAYLPQNQEENELNKVDDSLDYRCYKQYDIPYFKFCYFFFYEENNLNTITKLYIKGAESTPKEISTRMEWNEFCRFSKFINGASDFDACYIKARTVKDPIDGKRFNTFYILFMKTDSDTKRKAEFTIRLHRKIFTLFNANTGLQSLSVDFANGFNFLQDMVDRYTKKASTAGRALSSLQLLINVIIKEDKLNIRFFWDLQNYHDVVFQQRVQVNEQWKEKFTFTGVPFKNRYYTVPMNQFFEVMKRIKNAQIKHCTLIFSEDSLSIDCFCYALKDVNNELKKSTFYRYSTRIMARIHKAKDAIKYARQIEDGDQDD
jgi:hypothetical protein